MCMGGSKPSGPDPATLERQRKLQEAQLASIEDREAELEADEERRKKRLENSRMGYASLFTSGAGGGGFVNEDSDKRETLGG